MLRTFPPQCSCIQSWASCWSSEEFQFPFLQGFPLPELEFITKTASQRGKVPCWLLAQAPSCNHKVSALQEELKCLKHTADRWLRGAHTGVDQPLWGPWECQPHPLHHTQALHTELRQKRCQRGKTKRIVFGLSCKKLCIEQEYCGSRVRAVYTAKCLVASLRQRQTKLISSDLLCQKMHAPDYLWQIIAKEIVPQYPRHIPDLYIMKLFLPYDL